MAIVFDVVALLLPELTVGVVIGIFGAFTIVFGVIAVVGPLIARRRHEGWGGDVVEGIVAIAGAALVLAWPDLHVPISADHRRAARKRGTAAIGSLAPTTLLTCFGDDHPGCGRRCLRCAAWLRRRTW